MRCGCRTPRSCRLPSSGRIKLLDLVTHTGVAIVGANRLCGRETETIALPPGVSCSWFSVATPREPESTALHADDGWHDPMSGTRLILKP